VLALVRPFSLLLVDEQFVGLEPAGQEALAELLTAAADAGCAVIGGDATSSRSSNGRSRLRGAAATVRSPTAARSTAR